MQIRDGRKGKIQAGAMHDFRMLFRRFFRNLSEKAGITRKNTIKYMNYGEKRPGFSGEKFLKKSNINA